MHAQKVAPKAATSSSTGSPETLIDPRPHIRVISAHPDSFEEISFDAVTIKDYEKNQPLHYRLDFIAEEGLFFILSPKDVIKAMPRSIDDRIKWFIERCEFGHAFDVIKRAATAGLGNTIKVYTQQVVSLHYIDFLLMSKRYREASEWCGKVTLSAKVWEEKIVLFAKEGKLEEIYERIPTSNPTMAPAIYEQVLNEFLRLKQFVIFKLLILKW